MDDDRAASGAKDRAAVRQAFSPASRCAALFYRPVNDDVLVRGRRSLAWHATGRGKRLFFSFFACLMNWRAFLAYGTVTAAVTSCCHLALSGLHARLRGARACPSCRWHSRWLLVLLPTLFASF